MPRLLQLVRAALLAGLALAAPLAARAQESVYHGVFVTSNLDASLSQIADFEAQAGKSVAIVHVFQAIDGSGNVFPAAQLQRIRARGSIPLLTLEPWFDLRDVASGKHDAVLSAWAAGAKAWGHPFFLRYAHEMNSDWYPRWSVWPGNGNTAADYVAAWRRVHDIFRAAGASNATWVWCVNRFFDLPSGPSTRIADMYPGDRYVDWLSFDSYNRGTVGGNTWRSFADASGPVYDELLRVAPGKPVMVAETGTVEQGGDKAAWFRDALKNHLKTRFPRVKAWVWFNLDKGGYDNRIASTETARAAYAESVGLSYYSSATHAGLSAGPIPPLLNDAQAADTEPPFVRVVRPLSPRVPAGQAVEFRVEATDKNGVARVEFFADGVLRHTSLAAPHLFSCPMPAEPGTTVLVRAVAHDPSGNSAVASDTLVAIASSTPPAVLWGAVVNNSPHLDARPFDDFAAAAGRAPAILHLASAWAGRPAFPAAAFDAVRARGAIPLLSWEPRDPAGGANQPAYALRAILDGAHDAYLDDWARAAAAWGRPFFLRFAPQMNGDWFPWSAGVNGNTAADYVAAWRHVHRRLAAAGATNATWVWGVNRVFGGASDQIDALYPGDRYTDWVAMDGYNRGGPAWRDFTTTFGSTYARLLALAPAKPLMIAETGCVENGGDKAAWLRDALQTRLPLEFPRVRAVVYCEAPRDGFANSVSTSPAARAAFAESVTQAYYVGAAFSSLSASPVAPLVADALPTDTQPPFLYFSKPLGGEVPAGAVNELRLEFADRSALDRIEIFVDGALRQTERAAPYQFFWPTPATPGATYALRAVAYDAAGNSAAATHQVVALAPPHPADAWRALHFTPAELADPAVSGDAADPDRDGLANLLEYALGSDPRVPFPGPAVSLSPAPPRVLRLAFQRAASAAVRYEAQASSDLSEWTTIWTSSGAQNTAGPVVVSDTADLAAAPRRFLRLRVTRE